MLRSNGWKVILFVNGLFPPALAYCDCPNQALRISHGETAVLGEAESDLIFDWFLKLLQQGGCEYQLDRQSTTIERRLRNISEGKIDVILEATPTEDRLRYAWFSNPYREEIEKLYARKDNDVPSMDRFEQLLSSNWVLAGPQFGEHGAAYAAIKSVLREQRRLVEYKEFTQAITLLRSGRADVALLPTTIFKSAAHINANGLLELPAVFNRQPVAVMFSRKTVNEHTVTTINQLIQRYPFVISSP